MLDIFEHVDHDLAMQVAAGIGIAGPSPEAEAVAKDAVAPPTGRRSVSSSLALSQENMPKGIVKGRKITIVAAYGVDAGQLQGVKAALEGIDIRVEVVAPVLGTVNVAGGEDVSVDRSFLTTASVMYDAIYIPGGNRSVETLNCLGSALVDSVAHEQHPGSCRTWSTSAT